MSSGEPARRAALRPVMREGEAVTPLELFFDLVFVLALTQCTALMAEEPTWTGLAKGLVILGILWWSWVGYSWLTSVVDPEEGGVRIVMFAAMAAFLVCALAIPNAFAGDGLLFACAYAVVRFAHIGLFLIASREDAEFRRSTIGLGIGTTIGVAIIIGGSFAGPEAQVLIWALALALDMAEPKLFGSEGWKLVPAHFAERHGLIVIIALGESIVAIGIGAEGISLDAGVIAAAVLGVALSAALWWLYFDVVALVAARRLERAAAGRERNDIARDSFSYLHLPMVAGIVLVALGLKKTIEHTLDPLGVVVSAALFGGVALYLLADVLFRWRNVHRFSVHRLLVAMVAIAAVPLLAALPAAIALAALTALLVGLIVYEVVRFSDLRTRLRSELRHGV